MILATAASFLTLPAFAHDHFAFSCSSFVLSVPHIDLDEVCGNW